VTSTKGSAAHEVLKGITASVEKTKWSASSPVGSGKSTIPSLHQRLESTRPAIFLWRAAGSMPRGVDRRHPHSGLDGVQRFNLFSHRTCAETSIEGRSM